MTWTPLPGFDGVYEYSADGSVRRISGKRKGWVLKPTIIGLGYEGYYVQDSRANRAMFFRHRLVAMANIPNPDNRPEVNHKDGNKSNNQPANLEWVTHAENMAHAARTGLMRCTIGPGEKSRAAKLTDEKVRTIKRRLAAGERHGPIAADFGVSPSTIGWIAKGRTWAHVA